MLECAPVVLFSTLIISRATSTCVLNEAPTILVVAPEAPNHTETSVPTTTPVTIAPAAATILQQQGQQTMTIH